VIWAMYATRRKAEAAIAEQTFGDGPWLIAYKPERDPYPWCLMTPRVGP